VSNGQGRVTLTEQIGCIARDIARRRKIYPQFVRLGQMKQADADREIAMMEAVIETLNAELVRRYTPEPGEEGAPP